VPNSSTENWINRILQIYIYTEIHKLISISMPFAITYRIYSHQKAKCFKEEEPSLIWSQKFIRWWKSCCTVHTLQTTPQVATNNRTKSRKRKEKRQLARWKPNQYRHRYMQWCHMHGNSPSSCLATRPSSAQSSPAHLPQMTFFFFFHRTSLHRCE
jgi:hypothetical protein